MTSITALGPLWFCSSRVSEAMNLPTCLQHQHSLLVPVSTGISENIFYVPQACMNRVFQAVYTKSYLLSCIVRPINKLNAQMEWKVCLMFVLRVARMWKDKNEINFNPTR